MAMFPPAIPHFFVNWLTKPGDVVYDPFSGRGTTALEACLSGRIGLGSDANPLAHILTGAKVDAPEIAPLLARVRDLRACRGEGDTDIVPDHVRMLFSRPTLSRLVWLREVLNLADRSDRFLMATLLGILHGGANRDGTTRGLSISMPNTFSMAPGYVRRYIRDHNLRPPAVDPLDALEARIARLPHPGAGYRSGLAWLQNATARHEWPKGVDRAALVFTSPPYLQVILYGKFNWIRLWMLGAEPKAVDEVLFTSSSLDRYVEFMSDVLINLRRNVRDDGYVCMVIGDVQRGERVLKLAEYVARHCIPKTDLVKLGTVVDRLPVQHKVSRIWKSQRGRATKTDRILILAGPRARDLPPAIKVQWERPT
jgi:site-specific DNA-methyltransferase (adenine-specific)